MFKSAKTCPADQNLHFLPRRRTFSASKQIRRVKKPKKQYISANKQTKIETKVCSRRGDGDGIRVATESIEVAERMKSSATTLRSLRSLRRGFDQFLKGEKEIFSNFASWGRVRVGLNLHLGGEAGILARGCKFSEQKTCPADQKTSKFTPRMHIPHAPNSLAE